MLEATLITKWPRELQTAGLFESRANRCQCKLVPVQIEDIEAIGARLVDPSSKTASTHRLTLTTAATLGWRTLPASVADLKPDFDKLCQDDAILAWTAAC